MISMRRFATPAIGVAALALAGLSFAGTAFAGPAATVNVSEKAGPVSPIAQSVEDVHLASRLASWARQAKSAQGLVLAAQILSSAGAHEGPADKTSEGKGSSTGSAVASKTDKPEFTTAALLDEARSLAGPDQAIQAQIAQVASREGKGRKGGAIAHTDRVNAGATDVYTITFRGGEAARVVVRGDGDTTLGLFIYDQNGNEVCQDNDNSDGKYCSWTPAWTGTFKVKIHNDGDVYNKYRIATN
jgi:hypothetical protein